MSFFDSITSLLRRHEGDSMLLKNSISGMSGFIAQPGIDSPAIVEDYSPADI